MGQIVHRVITLFLTAGLCLSLLFVQKKHANLVCKAIEITIKEDPAQSFITPKEVVALLQSTHQIALCKTLLKYINAYTIQQQLKSHPLIKAVVVYKTWTGTLKICLETKHFIARVISLMEPNGRQIYVDEQGTLVTLQNPCLLRLLVITGNHIVTENSKLPDKRLLALLHYIYQDAFWKGQITSLQVEDNGKIILGTQVGGHQIAFGYPDKIHGKFEKLRIFYSQVMPYKGWRTYHRVNLAFKDQLICE